MINSLDESSKIFAWRMDGDSKGELEVRIQLKFDTVTESISM
jgi:hypothetical protein